jgi:putative phage-type endonuclease
MEQRSPEWFAERKGKVTASRIKDILATIRNGNWAAARKHYAAQLVAERLNDKPPEPFTNEYIEWGIAQEPLAREAYTKVTGNEVQDVGFINHPAIELAGASPDGLIGDEGCLEIKCPTTATHIETLLADEIPEQHKLQMIWQMLCAKRAWCDFVSFDPRLPEDMQLFVKRFHLDVAEAYNIEKEVRVFLAEVDTILNALQEKFRN